MLTPQELATVKLFKDLPDKELRSIANEMKEVEHAGGHQLATAGQSGVGFAVILEGEAEVRTVDGRARRLGPGESFGEMALLDADARSADIVAASDLRLAMLAEWGFKEFLASHPEVSFRLLQTLSRRLREAETAHR
jgi:CRP-like cAMP-binding protein